MNGRAAVPPDNDATNPVRIRHFPNPPGNPLHAKPFCIRPNGLSSSPDGTASPTQTVGADSIRPNPRILASTRLNGISRRLPPLGFPRGEAGFFVNRHFGTDWQKRLMRGSDTLKFQISRLNGIIWNIFHSFDRIHQPTCRRPSSVMINNRFRSADYLS